MSFDIEKKCQGGKIESLLCFEKSCKHNQKLLVASGECLKYCPYGYFETKNRCFRNLKINHIQNCVLERKSLSCLICKENFTLYTQNFGSFFFEFCIERSLCKNLGMIGASVGKFYFNQM